MADWARCGAWFATSLMENPEDGRGRQLYARDREDAETLVRVFLWRTRKDGTLRAMLTDSYAIINNEWFMEALAKLVPGGLCSHWRGDSDSIWGNILISMMANREEEKCLHSQR